MRSLSLLILLLISSVTYAFIVGGKDVDYASELAESIVFVSAPDETGAPMVCTGTFLSDEFVLTAAHCISNFKEDMSMSFRLKDFKQTHEVRDLEILDTYKFDFTGHSKVTRNDLGLIRFRKGLPEGAQIAILPQRQLLKPLKKIKFTAVGYGKITGLPMNEMESDGAGELRYKSLSLGVLDAAKDVFIVDQNKNNGGVCHGDSGGPGLVKDAITKKNMVIGVASAIVNKRKIKEKDACKNESMYLNMFFYAPFIKQKMAEMMK